MIDYSKLQRSLQLLEEQHNNLASLDASMPQFVKEALAESVIQRFEICFDCMWKVLRRHLEEYLGLSNVPYSPKPLFRTVHEADMLPSPIENWLAYANTRNATSHDYSGEKAQEALFLMSDFIKDAIALYQAMTETTWE